MGLVEEVYGQHSFIPNTSEAEDQPQHAHVPYRGPGYGWADALPAHQGLYNPEFEKDACGVGFTADIKGRSSHKIVSDGKFLSYAVV